MFAVVVRETGDADQIEASADQVATNVAPRVRDTPGFVSALWMSDRAGGTVNVLVYESEKAANAVLEIARTSPRPPFLKVESVALFRVLAHA